MFFFFNDTATTEIYTLSLHDALPISAARLPSADAHAPVFRLGRRRVVGRSGGRSRAGPRAEAPALRGARQDRQREGRALRPDRKSTRLNSSHANISYAVFCLKKKKTQ